MRLKYFIYILIGLALIGAGIFTKNALTLNVIILKNGEVIEVDRTWTIGTVYFYEKDEGLSFIEENEVENVITGAYNDPRILLPRIIFQFHQIGRRINSFWEDLPAKGVIISALSICILIAFLAIAGTKAKSIGKAGLSQEKRNATAIRLTKATSVEQFFLNVYCKQVSATLEDSVRILPVPDQSSESKRVFELKIERQEEEKTRRMSIGAIGDTGGSQSQCFYIIYDSHMVLKIPPVPINDFNDYIRRITKEARIVKRLSPKECIIPNVSVIMKAIHSFRDTADMSPEALESKYIYWLQLHPEYQDYLKIDGSFIFFMDLSRYYFLGHVMEDIHSFEDEIGQEIVHDIALIQDNQKFNEKYGEQNEAVCFALQKMYARFGKEIEKHLTRSDLKTTTDEKHKQEWFVSYLAGGEITRKPGEHSNVFLSEVKLLLQRIVKNDTPAVQTYRRIAAQHMRRRSFDRSRRKMEGLITNLIELLDWLGKCNVAMRDLKPDNLLVAGDADRYPLFLSVPEEYAIGLIDVETAVDYHTEENQPPAQPQLGGTPLFATPSHFFQNDILTAAYGDLKTVFHLQDWHAMVAIIYEIVTGEYLYPKSGGGFPEIMSLFQQVMQTEGNTADAYKLTNGLFWKTASEEFNAHISENREDLKTLAVKLPDDIQQQLAHYAKTQKVIEDRWIDTCIKEQKIFKGAQNRKRLYDFSGEDIIRFKIKFQKSERARKASPATRTGITKLLERLARSKQCSVNLSRHIDTLENPDSRLPVYDLLELMFGIVFKQMQLAVWDKQLEKKHNKICRRDLNVFKQGQKDISSLGYTTIPA